MGQQNEQKPQASMSAQHTPGPKLTPATQANLARDIQAAVIARRPDADASEAVGPWRPVLHDKVHRTWVAKNDKGEYFKDKRGVSCFDYPDLIAAIAKATGSN